MIINETEIGPGYPCYIIAEIGINHNGDIGQAIDLMEAAKYAGANAVKFQKRTLEIAIPMDMRGQKRYGTPWGDISYWDYKQNVEFDYEDYQRLKGYAFAYGLDWFASAWDVPSVHFLEELGSQAIKIPSAGVTNLDLVRAIRATEIPTIMSTGMSDWQQIDEAFQIMTFYTTDSDPEVPDNWVDPYKNIALLQCTATYPVDPAEINLRVMDTLREGFNVPIGYSNHHPGLTHCQNAVALGADILEAHITLDRASWGSDQASSIEPHGFRQLVKRVRETELALGDGIKVVYPSEEEKAKSLRPQDE